MSEKIDLLFVGQAENNSGFNRVFDSLLQYLCDTFKIVHFGINYRGEKIHKQWTIEPNPLVGDKFGTVHLEKLILKYNPKLIFICHDYWLYGTYKQILEKHKLIDNTVFYCPIEGGVPDSSRVSSFLNIKNLVFYTQYGYSIFLNEIAAAPFSLANEFSKNTTFRVMQHGIDTKTFYPIKGTRKSIRKQLFPERPELWDAFIILNANRNSPRKRIDLTIDAFELFLKKNKVKSYLYLHMATLDCGIDVRNYVKNKGIEKYVIYSNDSNEKPKLSDQELNLIYNACDIGVNTCDGEGWGLVAFEHAATRKCQVLPDHTANRELWAETVNLIPVDQYNTVDVIWLGNYFAELYKNPSLVEELANRSYQRTQDDNLSWKVIAKKWEILFQEIIERNVQVYSMKIND